MKSKHNYFLILGLDYRKNDFTAEEIQQAIKEKCNYWRENLEQNPDYRRYFSRFMDIDKVMMDPKLRNGEAKDAKEFIDSYLSEKLSAYASSGTISRSEAEAICKDCNLPFDLFTSISGLTIEENSILIPSVADYFKDEDISDVNPKPSDFQRVKKAARDLKKLGYETLYHFLAEDEGINLQSMQKMKGEELLRNYCEPIKQRYKNNRTDEATSVRNLCAICEEIFDESKPQYKESYDQYIIWNKVDALIKEMDTEVGADNTLDQAAASCFTDRLSEIFNDKTVGSQKFSEICKAKNISITSGRLMEIDNQILCAECGEYVTVNNGERECPICGADLYTHCLKCGNEIAVSDEICNRCHSDQNQLRTVQTLVDQFTAACEKNDYTTAYSTLENIDGTCPEYENKDTLRERLDQMKSSFQKIQMQLSELILHKKYVEAYQLLGRNPGYPYTDEKEIREKYEQCMGLLDRAKNSDSENEINDLIDQILEICSDCEIPDLLSRFPLQSPSDLKASVTGEGKIRLTWTPSPSKGNVYYRVFAKLDSYPKNPNEAYAQWKVGEECSIEDSGVKKNQTACYCLFTFRDEERIKNPLSIEVLNLPDITDLKCEVGDKKITLKWNEIPKDAEVLIYKKKGSIPYYPHEGTCIPNGSNQSYVDTGLENGIQYGYRVVLRYRTNGKDKETNGMTISGVPRVMPVPLMNYQIKTGEGGVFDLTWREGEYDYNSTRFYYYTGEKTIIKERQSDTEENLKSYGLTELKSCEKFGNGFSFKLPIGESYHIVPVVSCSGFAVIGKIQTVISMPEIEVSYMNPIGKDVKIGLSQWPEHTDKIRVQYGTGRYADSVEEAGYAVVDFTKRDYENKGALELQQIEHLNYYIRFYVQNPDRENDWIAAGKKVFENASREEIWYNIRVKGFITKKAEIEFYVKDRDSFELPPFEICAMVNSEVYYREKSRCIMKVDDPQRVDRRIAIPIPTDDLSPNTYVRPFFIDKDTYKSFYLTAAETSNPKIK